MDKYQWTCTGMATSDSANGPMRYIREIDYDALQAKVEELTAAGAGLRESMRQILLQFITSYPDEIEAIADKAIKDYDAALKGE